MVPLRGLHRFWCADENGAECSRADPTPRERVH